jgi:4-hydroxy-tetrahydrodipicolinate reductase
MNKIPLIVLGATGRMGQAIVEQAYASPLFEVAAAIVKSTSPRLGEEIKPGLRLKSLDQIGDIDDAVLVDFSYHQELSNHIALARQKGWALMVGTTGHSGENLDLMKKAATEMALMYAPNTSLMNQLFTEFCKSAARVLNDAQVELLEMHHAGKKDAPSGTVLKVVEGIKEARGTPNAPMVTGRLGEALRSPDEIGIFAVRGGGSTCEHTAYFFHQNERLELSHRIFNRSVLAEGALFASQFVFGKPPGLYGMNDVLNLKMYCK